jgi:nucleotide-binding universal stress UspA family protein
MDARSRSVLVEAFAPCAMPLLKRLLVPVDGSPLAEYALDTAAALARACGGTLGIIRASEPRREGIIDATVDYTVDPAVRGYVRELAERLADEGDIATNGAVGVGAPAEVILRRARELGTDLIVMTTHGRTGLRRAWLGSVANEVLRTSHLPVLMLRGPEDDVKRPARVEAYRRVLVPLDGSKMSAAVLPSAAVLARCGRGSVVLLRIVHPLPLYVANAEMPAYPAAMIDPEVTRQLANNTQEELDGIAPAVADEYDVQVHALVVTAESAADGILDTAERQGADAIAMTTSGRGASRLIVGSVTDKVLRRARYPMLLYRPRPDAE